MSAFRMDKGRGSCLEGRVRVHIKDPFGRLEYNLQIFWSKLLQVANCWTKFLLLIGFLRTQTGSAVKNKSINYNETYSLSNPSAFTCIFLP